MIDLHTHKVLNRGHLQRDTAVVQRGVNLCGTVAGNVHPGITHNRDQVHALAVGGNVHQHDGVGTGAAHQSRLGTGAGVATQQQNVLARSLDGVVAVAVIENTVAVLIMLARVSGQRGLGTLSRGRAILVGDLRCLQLGNVQRLCLAKLLFNLGLVFIHLGDGIKFLGLAIPGMAGTP